MKNRFIKITAISTIFAFGLGLVVFNNSSPTPLKAEPHLANYADYTYVGSYYNTLDLRLSDGMNGAFREALTDLIEPSQWYTYGSTGANTLSTQLQYADEDPTNSDNMVYFYTRDSVAKNAASSWNREHVWPQSLSSSNYGENKAGTDILHIRPTYDYTNGQRGSKLMGDLNHQGEVKYNGKSYGYIYNGMFEPLDSVKGDVARIFMYVWTAYKNLYASKPMNILNVIESYDTLIKWHTEDKPDLLEGNRNNYAESSNQGNRNPFVDHPEYAWKIFGDSVQSDEIRQNCINTYPMGDVSPLERIVLSGTPSKTEYYVGETFDPRGLTVTAYFEDTSSANIPTASCTWTPKPLTEGTTSVTCTYAGKSATYNGITVTKRDKPVAGDSYGVVFEDSSADGSTSLPKEDIPNYYESNELIKTVNSVTKVFEGKTGLKLGSGSDTGSITFTVYDELKNHVVGISVKTAVYRGDSGKLRVKIDSTTLTSTATPGEDYIAELDDISITRITIESTSKRLYLKEVSITLKGDDPTPPPTPTSSSSNNTSSSEPSAAPSENSSAAPSNNDSSEVINSSENNNSSSIDDTPKENAKGCHGSVVATLSMTSFSALIGLVFILSKKRR